MPDIISLLDFPAREMKPLSDKETKNFMSIFLAEQQGKKDIEKKILTDYSNDSRACEALVRRLQAAGAYSRISPLCIVYISTLAESFGDVAIWTYTIFKTACTETQPLTISMFSELFPWGIPTREQKDLVWNKQKRQGGNAFDLPETYNLDTWEPVRFPI